MVKHEHIYIQSYCFEKNTTEKSVAITNQSFFVLDSWNDENFVGKNKNKNQCITINKFVYEKPCYKSSTSKYEKSNSNINTYRISYLPFDMLCYLLEYMMKLWKMHRQPTSTLKWPVDHQANNNLSGSKYGWY